MIKVCPENLSDDGKFLWSNMLEDVKDNTTIKLSPQRLLLVLGEEESGKTTLTSYLQGSDDPKKSFALEYQFIDIKDEYQDDQTKLGAYTLGGNIHLSNLIRFVVNESNFGDAMALIVVSIQEPWSIMDSLNSWYDVLRIYCEHLHMDPIVREEYKQSLVRHFREYVEPSDQMSDDDRSKVNQGPLLSTRRHINPLHPQASSHLSTQSGGTPTSPIDGQQDNVTLPLSEGVLEYNLGIPLVVVVTKTDLIGSLAKEHNLTEEHFEVIQMHIRRFCLSRGAALFYVSVKEEKNCDVLKGYLKNRIYGLPFTQSAYVVEKDCVFVPTGWDSLKKIKILDENLAILKGKLLFNECIPKPLKSKTGNKDGELMAIDEQKFLESLNRELEKVSAKIVPQTDMDHGPKKSPINRTTAAGHVTSTRNKPQYVTPSPANKEGEGVLANFFNSLLKKTNAPAQPGTMAPPITSMSPMSLPNTIESVTEENGNASLSDVDS